MKKNWMLLFLLKSISQRKGRVIVASVSVTLAVAVISGMIGITSGINEKLGSELKAYGANIIVAPGDEGHLDQEAVGELLKIKNITDADGQVFGSVNFNGSSIDFIGVDINRLKDKGWRFMGEWPDGKKEILAGINLKKALDIEAGAVVRLSSSTQNEDQNVSPDSFGAEFIVSGFVERGSAEDNAFIIQLSAAWELTGLNNELSAVLVRSNPGEIDSVVSSIKKAFPLTEVKTLRQVAYAEESLLSKIQLLMTLVTFVVLIAAVISVGSTMGANVLERREEIGLMMTLGATKNGISSIYAMEAAVIGLLGGITGFVLGYISIQVISQGAFGSYISIPFYLVFLSVAVGLLIALLASHLPVRDALRYSPAEILRGE